MRLTLVVQALISYNLYASLCVCVCLCACFCACNNPFGFAYLYLWLPLCLRCVQLPKITFLLWSCLATLCTLPRSMCPGSCHSATVPLCPNASHFHFFLLLHNLPLLLSPISLFLIIIFSTCATYSIFIKSHRTFSFNCYAFVMQSNSAWKFPNTPSERQEIK